ncbi:MAG: hypothetical protein XD91_1853 [Clostridiales bacterium 38_11]|nr:MAG: hypothetical protein XD91_1853 [Clostridiales bacterium 38_11]HBH11861.1 hypothetical protein [Clostridiales bacterium]
MERQTRKTQTGSYEIINMKKAAESLAKFEDFYEYVVNRETLIPEELAKLRNEGKEKTLRFRELMGQKLLNTSFISLLKQFDIK